MKKNDHKWKNRSMDDGSMDRTNKGSIAKDFGGRRPINGCRDQLIIRPVHGYMDWYA